MTWDKDQADSLIKSYNWTNFEKKSCRMSTSTTRTLSQIPKKYWTKPYTMYGLVQHFFK